MWKTIDADGYPPAGAECFVWAEGWAKSRIAEAHADPKGFSNASGEVEGVTHWVLLGYPPIPASEEAPAPKPKRKS